MNFKDYLNEKLQLSQYRQIVKMWKQSGISQKFDHIFGSKDRLYEPFEGEIGEITGKDADGVKAAIRYYNTIFKEKDVWQLGSYTQGLVISNTGKKIRLGKFLTNFIQRLEKDKTRIAYPDDTIKSLKLVLKEFNEDPKRNLAKAKNLLICYSRHAYDIAGMSTDRGWNSCMELPGGKKQKEGGVQAHLVPTEIKTGTIIAYLIKDDDKNLQSPIGRMLIKPFVNKVNNEMMMVACTGGYGTVPNDMIQQVSNWTEKFNKKVGFGVFQFAGSEDTHVKKFQIGKYPKTIEDFKKTFKSVDVFTSILQLLGKDILKKFEGSKWNDTDEFKVAEVGPGKVYIYDIDSMMKNFTEEDFINAYKHGFETADDISYELLKTSRNLANSIEHEETRKKIVNISIIAYMVKEHKYSTEPDLRSEDKFNLWLHSNQMHTEKNQKLYEPMKLYYEKLKKIMRK